MFIFLMALSQVFLLLSTWTPNPDPDPAAGLSLDPQVR